MFIIIYISYIIFMWYKYYMFMYIMDFLSGTNGKDTLPMKQT